MFCIAALMALVAETVGCVRHPPTPNEIQASETQAMKDNYAMLQNHIERTLKSLSGKEINQYIEILDLEIAGEKKSSVVIYASNETEIDNILEYLDLARREFISQCCENTHGLSVVFSVEQDDGIFKSTPHVDTAGLNLPVVIRDTSSEQFLEVFVEKNPQTNTYYLALVPIEHGSKTPLVVNLVENTLAPTPHRNP